MAPLLNDAYEKYSLDTVEYDSTVEIFANDVLCKNVTAASTQKSQETSKHPGRSVSFSAEVQVHPTLCLDDYTDEEYLNSWLTPEEMKEIKRDMRRIITILNLGATIEESNENTTRGLEYRTKEGGRKRTRNKIMAREAVLDEQDNQWDTYSFDPEYLALVYKSIAEPLQFQAELRGKIDEKASNEINSSFSFPCKR